MPLYIRDEGVDRLAVELMVLTGAKSKTDAVRTALQAQINAAKKEAPLLDVIRGLQRDAAKIGAGQGDPAFDQKAFADDMWGE